MTPDTAASDHDRLVFGAGFAFGVACVLLVLTIVAMTATAGSAGTAVLGPVIAGVFGAGAIGAVLFLLAYPENRERLPVATGLGDDSA